MAVDDSSDPLDRATAAIRSEESAGWPETSQKVIAKVRRLVMPAALLMTFGDDGRTVRGPQGSTVRVSGRVLVPRLRDAVDTETRATDSIDLTVVDDRCAGVRVGLVCSYGGDLQAEGASVRADVTAVLHDLLGVDPGFDPDRDVVVEIVDVVEGDPHRQ